MPALPPGLGDFVAKVLRGGTEIGAVDAVKILRAAYHLAAVVGLRFGRCASLLCRYYGSSGTPKNMPEDMEAGKPFYPHQVFEDVVGMLILFVILAAVAIFVPVPLEDVADPTNADYDPRPEWYFLFLFQLLKYFQGPFEVIGTFVIPTVGMLLLLFLPFLDRSERAVLWKRPIALTVTSVSVIGIVVLTILGGTSKKLETTEATSRKPRSRQRQCEELHANHGDRTVEEGEEVFDFQLTDEEIEGAVEVEESQ